MSDKFSEQKTELSQLVEEGSKLCDALVQKGQSCKDLPFFVTHYEQWYTKALVVVRQLIPERTEDFTNLYKNTQRAKISYANYCISDALHTLTEMNYAFGPWSARTKMTQQTGMLRACLERIDSKLFDMKTLLQADIFDSELDSAKHLLNNGFIRAAGAICGVVLEKHFSDLCSVHGILIDKKDPTISTYNDKLKDVIYDTIEWRRIQRLGDLRNLCDHNKDREPTTEEVEELIMGTDRVIKTVF